MCFRSKVKDLYAQVFLAKNRGRVRFGSTGGMQILFTLFHFSKHKSLTVKTRIHKYKHTHTHARMRTQYQYIRT